MLALQNTSGYVNFWLAPPRGGEDETRYFEVMYVLFDPARISRDVLAKLIAEASGLAVTDAAGP